MRPALILSCSLLLSACLVAEPPSNSTGSITVTGDDSWSSPLKGLGLRRTGTSKGSACNFWLFDVLSKFGGDQYPNDRDATYVLQLSLGRDGQLASYLDGVQAQGDASQGTSAPWPSETAASFDRYGGSKHGIEHMYVLGGTVTISRFDAAQLVGSFALTGKRSCPDAPDSYCHVQASGDFDVANVDCVVPVAP